jgi:membrane associated rhomboid family serine protease
MMRREHWHLTEAILFLHFAAFLFTFTRPEAKLALMLHPSLVFSEPWRLLTFQFIHGHPVWFLISMWVLWIMARPIEESWGSPRFLAFWLISILGAGITAVLLGQALAGDVFFTTSLLFTFATLYPDYEFLMFLILPVKVRWLAIIAGGYLVISSLFLGFFAGIANVVGMSSGYVFFLLIRNLPTRRKVAFEMKRRKAVREVASEGAAQAQRNAGWDPSVREAEAAARETGEIAERDLPLLAELDAAVDSTVTVCAPEDFGYVDDAVCRTCAGYPECAARRIRLAAEQTKAAQKAENAGDQEAGGS